MMMMGTTISFAGKPRMNAVRMYPSIPRSRASGSRNAAHRASRLTPPGRRLASSQRTAPAGAATAAARRRTNSVRSRMERTMTLPICGRRYGGSSRLKEDGTPLRTVFDSSFEISMVRPTPSTMTAVSIRAETTDRNGAATVAAKNIVMTAMRVGKRPLQGTKLLVRMAISLSRGESMMRQPITPQALQPKPMHMVSDCLPCAPALRKKLSRLNATRGRYPKSSSSVNSGKKMAIGGSITATTHARVR